MRGGGSGCLPVQAQPGGRRGEQASGAGLLNHPSGPVIPCCPCCPAAPTLSAGARHITISTVGVPQAIPRLAARSLQSTLAVSIHAPTQVAGPAACAGDGEWGWGSVCAAVEVCSMGGERHCRAGASAGNAALRWAALLGWRAQRPPALAPAALRQALRERIVPSAKAYPLDALMADCTEYFRCGAGRRARGGRGGLAAEGLCSGRRLRHPAVPSGCGCRGLCVPASACTSTRACRASIATQCGGHSEP